MILDPCIFKKQEKITNCAQIFIKSYGCAQNRFDAQQLSCKLKKALFFVYNQGFGSDKELLRNRFEYAIASKIDYFVIFTCPLTYFLEQLIIDSIRRIQQANRKAKIIITGCSLSCSSSIFTQKYLAHGKNIILVSSDKLINLFSSKKVSKGNILVFNDKSLGTLLIKRGCSNGCSYCVCPKAHKPIKHIGFRDILAQIKTLELADINFIEFGGSCVGDWRNPNGKISNFLDLLRFILENTNFKIVNLELHPNDINSELITLLADPRIDKDISIPIQSASDATLKNMKRKYNSKYLHELFKSLFKLIPNIKVSTDIIVGFPGENKTDFSATVSLLKEYPFHRIDVYRYSNINKNKERGYNFSSHTEINTHKIAKLFEINNIAKKNINITSL